MRAYGLIDFQVMVIAFFLGVVGCILGYLAWKGYATRNPGRIPREEPEPGFPPGMEDASKSERNRIAPLLVVVYAGTVIWLLAYWIIIGIFGGPID